VGGLVGLVIIVSSGNLEILYQNVISFSLFRLFFFFNV
jgi:hypothetical protein